MVKLVHIIEKFFNSGAASSLKQIYDSLQGSSVVSSQEVMCLKSGVIKPGKTVPQWFPVPAKYISYNDFYKDTKSKDYDNAVFVFHKLMCSPTSIYSNMLNRTGKPFFIINHTYSDTTAFNRLFKFPVCVTVSDHMKYKLSKYNKNIDFFTIRNIVDVDYVSSYPSDIKDNSIFKTGRINSLNTIKYNSDFIRWVCKLRLDKKHLHEYVGGGQYMNEANNIIMSNNNEYSSCVMAGSILDNNKKFGKLKSWDAFLYHINRPEGTSMSVLESLACGVPVICSDTPGNNELIKNGVNGYVFKTFAEGEEILKDLSGDDEKMNKLRASTLTWSKENLTKERLRKDYEQVISHVVSKYKPYSSSYVRQERVISNKIERKTERIKAPHREKAPYREKAPGDLVREKAKRVVEERMASKKETAQRRLFNPVAASIKNNVIVKPSNEVGNYVKNTLSSDALARTFVPIYDSVSVLQAGIILSDYFGVCNSCENISKYTNAIKPTDIDASNVVSLSLQDLSMKKTCLEDLSRIENSEILFVDSRNLSYIKNIIIKSNNG